MALFWSSEGLVHCHVKYHYAPVNVMPPPLGVGIGGAIQGILAKHFYTPGILTWPYWEILTMGTFDIKFSNKWVWILIKSWDSDIQLWLMVGF